MSRSARALAAAHPGRCRLRQIGTSRQGRPLELLSVEGPDGSSASAAGTGTGSPGPGGGSGRDVLAVAVPHSNEPLGGATVLALAERALRDPGFGADTAVTWNFLLCLDPDGALRHETGPDERHSLYDHHRHFFRPVTDEQPEWAPSLRSPGESLPETRALARLIDELRPFLQFSLHGADVDGSWVQLTRDIPGLALPFGASAAELGIPVAVGSCDAAFWPSPGPGVYVMPPPGRPAGFASQSETVAESTWYFPHLYGGVTAVLEVPMWGSPLMSDQRMHPTPWQALHRSADGLRRSGAELAAVLDRARPYFTAAALGPKGDSPLLRAAERAVQICPGLADDWDPLRRQHRRSLPDPLTRARISSLDALAHRIPLRATAMLLQLLDGATDPRAVRLHAELDAQLARRCEAYLEELRAVPIPVTRQVAHQARAAVATYRCLLAQSAGGAAEPASAVSAAPRPGRRC
ncbi:M14 family zinc carboxypeptidase [Streptacidiphilus cavernicola]|uniref:M14 family zinc carboxypeptidase n=1 Tax=Streptacidiphilus cavernicola TaxID=3342716 RepID=A0ABV6W3K6_9ACTN